MNIVIHVKKINNPDNVHHYSFRIPMAPQKDPKGSKRE